MMKRISTLALVGLSLAMALGPAPPARARVSIQNGNFFIGYTDVAYAGGLEMKIQRVYNSKTPFNGLFGWGWGSDIEHYLAIAADGSVVLNEYGGGAQNIFSPPQFDTAELDAAIEKLSAAARQNGEIAVADQEEVYRQRLRSEVAFRNDEWEKFVRRGLLARRRLAPGTKLQSRQFGAHAITRTAAGYERAIALGGREVYDEAGRLVRRENAAGDFIALRYGPHGRLSGMSDSQGHDLRIRTNGEGRITRGLTGEGGEALYRYTDSGHLCYSRDVDGNTYEHRYSPDGRHNMTAIPYQDGT